MWRVEVIHGEAPGAAAAGSPGAPSTSGAPPTSAANDAVSRAADDAPLVARP